MKLEERLEKALAEHNLSVPAPTPTPTITEEKPPQPKPKPKTVKNDYNTIKEGLQHLSKHKTDEDGIGCFTAKKTGLGKIQLPMIVGDYVIEDIQRVKTGNYQVHFRKSEHH
jgi:hypothetical protein